MARRKDLPQKPDRARLEDETIFALDDSEIVKFPQFTMKGAMRKALRREKNRMEGMSEAAIIRRALTVYLGGD